MPKAKTWADLGRKEQRAMTPEQVANRKKRIKNPDKTVSTERSITVSEDGGYINIPTIVNGRQVSDKEAIQAHKSGSTRRRRFKTVDEAVIAAKERSDAIGRAIEK